MKSRLYFSAIFLVFWYGLGAMAQSLRPPPTEDPIVYTCENITQIEFCSQIGYTTASFPNYRDQDSQTAASSELENFRALAQSVCSNAVVHFLCSVYAPFCDPVRPEFRVPPCRELCEYVREGCEPPVVQFGLRWPPHLECSRYPTNGSTLTFCPPVLAAVKIPLNIETNAPPNVTEPTVLVTTGVTPRTCPFGLRVDGTSLGRHGHVFAGMSNCSVNCSGIYFTDFERNTVAPALILFFAIVCVIFTVFTVATFLIDRRRFHYPERPIIFLSFCYLVIAVAYIVGVLSKLAGGAGGAFSCVEHGETNERANVFQKLPNSETTYKSASCVILFVLVYFFQMASAMWWVVLTFTWFLAAALKWGEEAVEKLWLLYHIIAWSVPAIQVILVLALRLVDGDQLAGICYTGHASNVGLGVFVFLPLFVYLALGIVFLVIGFTALVNIHRQLQRDPQKSRKLGRLIMRIGIYSLLYVIPNVILLILYLYELASNENWQLSYAETCSGTEKECNSPDSPTFAAFIIRYLMLFAIGVCSTSWILSSKTVAAWKKFFCSCSCHSEDPAAHMYDVPDRKRDLSMQGFHHPQTSV